MTKMGSKENQGDCDDDPAVNPGATEIPDNEKDITILNIMLWQALYSSVINIRAQTSLR